MVDAECPDCTAEVGEPTLDELGIWHIAVAHDATCPELNRLSR